MNMIIIFQLVVAFALGFSGLFIIHRVVTGFLVRNYQIDENDNLSLTIFQVGVILSGGLILSSIVDPAVNAIRLMNPDGALKLSSMGTALGYIALFAVIGILATLLVITGGLVTIFQMTKVNEVEELKNKRINSSLIAAAFIVAIAFIVSSYCGHLCEALIPYPEVMTIR
ncbi:MAG: hypothetical protein LW688_03635 [Cryomorphaceae bacterium]|jgi:hypothetical protein|nr:hypothetical protein [Cryomorphaceae bacterium]